LITFATETLVPLRKCKGLQPISPIFLIAWAANFGLVKLRKTSAPDAFNLTTWESMVGSEVS
jgi:hypothetical protein